MYQLIIFSAVALLCLLAFFVFRKRESKFDVFLKIITVLFCVIGFVRFFLPDSFAFLYNGAVVGVGDNKQQVFEHDYLQTILRWGYFSAYSILPMAVFYKGRFFKNVASYFTLPFAVASAIYFNDFMKYFFEDERMGTINLHMNNGLRYAFFILELVLAISIPILVQIKDKHYFNVKSPREWIRFVAGLICIIPITMPIYSLQSLVGFDSLRRPPMFGTFHFLWIGITVVAILALYFMFRFKTYEERLMLCMFLTLVLFFHYNSFYLSGITIKRLPFQLCNIACYFYLVAMVFKFKKMFHFCFLANIVGTIIAIFVFDVSAGWTSLNTIHYTLEHSLVLIVPALVMGLRIFPRVTLRSFKYYFVGFTAFFLFVFIVGTVLNGYSDVTNETVNYFYIFDRKMLFGEGGFVRFLSFLEDWEIKFGRFEIYPLIAITVYAGFSALSFLFYLFVRFLYRFEDDHLELRRSSIELYEKISHRKSIRPKDYID